MMVVLASKSQIQTAAVTRALENFAVDSGVSMQPLNGEILQGARLVAWVQRSVTRDQWHSIAGLRFAALRLQVQFDLDGFK